MTGNQLTYWRNQEEVRHNVVGEQQKFTELAEIARANKENERLKELQVNESVRHNFATESFEQVRLELEKKGIELQDREQYTKLVEMYAKYGIDKMSDIPNELWYKLGEEYGLTRHDLNYHDNDIGTAFKWAFKYMGEAWKNFWSIGKAGSALF